MSSITPIVEIIILFLMFYLILLGMRGTRGTGMLKGLFFIFMVSFLVAVTVSTIFELNVVLYILRNWLPNIMTITLIVIFHPELRNTLLKLGQTKLFHRFFKTKSMILDEIIEAAVKLPGKKIL